MVEVRFSAITMKKELIKKYLRGECSFEEEQQVKAILETKDGSQLLDDLADEIWQQEPDPKQISLDDARLFRNIENSIPRKKVVPIRSYIGYAASFILIALATFFVIQYETDDPQKKNLAVSEKITKSTSRGQKSTIMLSDGSKVILNSESSITYNKYFTDTSRNITLIGEAFFEVAKDKKRPFNVTSGATTTTALGTSFNINNRTKKQRISLATGKVKIISTVITQTYTLDPGEALDINSSTKEATKLAFDINKDLSWKDGILFFENDKVAEIISTLELWYDVKINITDKEILAKKYTGRFENSSLEHVLKSMSFALDLSYQMNGKNITIKNAN
ncbi:FecR family protein [Fulvivirga sp. RKSG066]|nr:FecR family protein [Fulvivirga aurantia]